MVNPVSFAKAALSFYDYVSDASNVSLSSFIKSSYITSRVYIDGTIAQEPITTDILRASHMLYCSYIMNAFAMNQYIASAKTLKDGITAKDYLSIVATESLMDYDSIVEALEAEDEYISIKKTSLEKIAKVYKNEKDKNKALNERNEELEKEKTGQRISVSERDISADNKLPAGRLLELRLQNPEGKETVTLNLLVQMFPYIVGSGLISQFVTKDYVPNFLKRLIQWKVGEISFWKDLVANMDIIHKRSELIVRDSSGVVKEELKRQSKNRSRLFKNFKDSKQKYRNLANAVLILDKDTVDRVYSESGLNLNNPSDRNRYFTTSFTMMIIVVDTMHNLADFYINGIDVHGTYTFDQLHSRAKKDGGIDLMDFIKAMGRSQLPKF